MTMMILVEYLVLHQDGKTSSVTRCLRTGKQQERYKCATFDKLMLWNENFINFFDHGQYQEI